MPKFAATKKFVTVLKTLFTNTVRIKLILVVLEIEYLHALLEIESHTLICNQL